MTADVIDVHAADARPRSHAGEVPPRALARRGRGALHHRGARRLPLPSAAPAPSSRSRSRRETSSACPAGRGTGSTSAATSASAPSACSRIPRAGRRATRRAAWTRATSPCAGARRTSRADVTALDTLTRGVRAFLLDIEGTTTPVAFVYDVLFPYARREMRGLPARAGRRSGGAGRARPAAGGARAGAGRAGVDGGRARRFAYVDWLMDARSQEHGAEGAAGAGCGEDGYRRGALQGRALSGRRRRRSRGGAAGGRSIFIYSSGSVLAQRLLFAHTAAGDLTPLARRLLRHHDRAEEGGGQLPANCPRDRASPPGDLLFVSDSAEEVAAALEAGLRAVLCARDGMPRPV